MNRLRCGLICLLLLSAILQVWAQLPDPHAKRENIRVRLIAREASAQISATSRNADWYVIEIQSKSGEKQLARLQYTFLHYEPRLLGSLFEYGVVYKFRAVRDRSCDSTMAEERRWIVGYSIGSPTDIDASTALPCYVATPKDLRGTEKAIRKSKIAAR
jgi:hypothetical protein